MHRLPNEVDVCKVRLHSPAAFVQGGGDSGRLWLGNLNMLSDPFFMPEFADDMGLVATGGDLRPERLLLAYRRGIFPWYDEGYPICWWSPDPRAIFELDGLHIPRRLRRTIRSGQFGVTVNKDFGGVIRGCADRAEGTWIVPEMIAAYETLYRLGHATASKSGTAASWPAGFMASWSVGCLRASRCLPTFAMLPRWPWFTWSIGSGNRAFNFSTSSS